MFWKKSLVLAAVAVALQFNPILADCSTSSCDPCSGWDFSADWIYWITRRCDLDYAIQGKFDNYNGKVKDVEPGYESGFRLGLFKDCGDIDCGLRYTYYSASESDTAIDKNDELIKTRIGGSAPFAITFDGAIEYAKGDYDLDYDLYDLEAGYKIKLSNCLFGRLFGGFRAAFIDQDFDVVYAERLDLIFLDNHDIVKHSWDMDAYGIFLGAETSYLFNDSFSLFGSLSGAFLLGDFDRKFLHIQGNSTFSLTNIDIKDDCHKWVNSFDFALGMQYSLCEFFCADWAVSFGYEYHHWFNTPDFLTLVADGANASVFGSVSSNITHMDHHNTDISFDGLFVRLSASF